MRTRLRSLLLAALLVQLGACSSTDTAIEAPAQPFFEEFGGMPAITATVDAFLGRLAADERIVERFAMTDVARFRRLLIEQFCVLAGGPCTYTGASMAAAHRTQGIRADEFDALVRDLMDAMNEVGVPRAAQNRLLGRLAPMYGDIVAP
ncbi:MAG TPA: group 1 truncated hemoglobin [Pseudomonadales bacterium]|nr:group 1 truncated hemoglobin [Pseudomonadales bacterium]